MSSKFRIVLAEDEPRILQFLEKKIPFLDPRFEIVGSARNGMDALALIEELHPHVLISDVQMPVMNGLELLSHMNTSCMQIKCVIISGFRDFDYVREAMRYEAIDYLLKPIVDLDLLKLLHTLADELNETIRLKKQETISAAIENRLDLTNSCVLPDQQNYSITLLTIGHLMNPSSQILHSRVFQNIWKKINFQTLLKNSGISPKNWWLCNGWSINHKYFVCTSEDMSAVYASLPTLLEQLKLHSDGYPVNLCMLPDTISLYQLHQGVLALQESVWQTLVPGKSQVLPLKDEINSTSYPLLLTSDQCQLLKSLISSGRTEDIKKLLQHIFENWLSHQYPQVAFENGLRQLFRLFAYTTSMTDENELYLAEYHTFAFLSICRTPEEIFPEVWEAVLHFLNRQAVEKNYALKTTADIEQYIRLHYTEDISLDSIASIMGFHTVYLNRIFKREKQITPIQFLITLRMEKARELIRQHPDWDFTTIGDSVGYHDPHYFSRAFKKATGMSPSEYRRLFGPTDKR